MAAKKHLSREKRRKFLWVFLGLILLLVLLFTFFPSSIEALFNGSMFKPKTTTVLPADIQKAIENEAVKELTQGYDYKHTDVAAQVDPQEMQAAESGILANNPLYVFKKAGRRIQEFFTFDPLAKAQLILKHNSWEMAETLSLLQKSSKQKNQPLKDLAVNVAANEISGVEGRFNQILSLSASVGQTDKNKAKAINSEAFNYAEKYFRDELILQGLEEKFDDSTIIRIESARLKRLGAFAQILIKNHPDTQILARELANSIAPQAGTDYKELKTAQLLQELEDTSSDKSQKLALRHAQYILIERFEKKVLAMPVAKRQVLLDTLINEIPGNPMREFKTFSRIRRVFKSRELIIYAELYKAKILERFEERVLGLSTSSLQSQFVTSWVKDPADLRILEALELRAIGQKDTDPKIAPLIKSLKKLAYDQIAKSYVNNPEKLKDTLFYESATLFPDVLDIKVGSDLNKVFDKSDFIKNMEKQIVSKFVSNLPVSLSGVVASASPQNNSLLSEIKSYIPPASLNEVSSAITAETTLDSILVPETSTEINNLVNDLEQSPNIAIITQNLQASVEEVILQADTQVSAPTAGEIIQRTEQLTEEIFSAPSGQETPVEEELPPTIQQEIEQVQETTNSVPQVDQTLIETVVNTVEQTQPSAPTTAPEITQPAPTQSAPSAPAPAESAPAPAVETPSEPSVPGL